MPQPSSSIQPEYLHLRQPDPPQKGQLICTSAQGSVKGKKDGKKRVRTLDPNKLLHGVVERALEVGEGDVGVDAEAFQLVEDWRVSGVRGVVAVHLAGNDDADGRRLCSMVWICTGEV